jgi:hypothetical protein
MSQQRFKNRVRFNDSLLWKKNGTIVFAKRGRRVKHEIDDSCPTEIERWKSFFLL